MVALDIKKDQGLTQALKEYALKNGLISEEELKNTNWENTIFKLKEIQDSRKTNNKDSIFTGGTEHKDWHNNFVVNEGKTEFTKEELDALIKAMGAKEKAPVVTPPVEDASKKTPPPPVVTPPVEPKEKTPVAPAATKGTINSDKIKGTYELSASDNKDGYALKTDMELTGEQDITKFYGDKDIKQDPTTKEYSVRGLKSQDMNVLRKLAASEVNTIACEQAVYIDITKKNLHSLTLPEIKFLENFWVGLSHRNLAINDKNEIVEKTAATTAPTDMKTVTKKKNFFRKLFGGKGN